MGRPEFSELSHCHIEQKERLFLGRVIALEGPVCAGKTTVLRNLAQRGLPTLREYGEYVVSAKNDFPSFPPRTKEEALSNFQFFLELEQQRFADSRQFSNERTLVLDRSVLSLLAFEYTAPPFTGINILPEATRMVAEHPGVVFPDKVVYLHVSHEKIVRRRQLCSGFYLELLLDPVFNNGFREFFEKCSEQRPEWVTIVNTHKSIAKVTQEVLAVISS